MTTATLPMTGRQILSSYGDTMTSYMVSEFHVSPPEAEAAIGQLWDRWVERCMEDTGCSEDEAITAITAGLNFMADKTVHVPDPTADAGWHTMLPYTQEYAALCHAMHGQFIHHRPNDIAGFTFASGGCSDKCISGGDD